MRSRCRATGEARDLPSRLAKPHGFIDRFDGRLGAPGTGVAGGCGAAGNPPARAAGIDHACVAMENFDPAAVTKTLVSYGLTRQEGQGRTPLVTYISLRMPNRGGAEGGTPELSLTDPTVSRSSCRT